MEVKIVMSRVLQCGLRRRTPCRSGTGNRTTALTLTCASHLPQQAHSAPFGTKTVRGPHPPELTEEEKIKVGREGHKAWKDAASLILAAPNPHDKDATDFLVMKRSMGSSFAPNTLCFPGGTVAPADSDKGWIDLFMHTTGSDIASDISFLGEKAVQPQIYTQAHSKLEDLRTLNKDDKVRVPPNVALRIAAVRETFEECGILVVRHNVVEEARKKIGNQGQLGLGYTAGTHVMSDPDEVEDWQKRVKRDPYEFIEMCKDYQIRPDLNALVEWSNWLTPNSFGPRRYDTIFYMAVLPHSVPFLNDEFEVATIRWTSADKVIKGAKDGKAKLIPPQIYELSRLNNTNTQQIKQLMRTRLVLGLERWCPCYIKVDDGIISVFPGDDLYPEDYKIDAFEELREQDITLEEARRSTKRHHRIEFKSEFEFELVVNVGPRCGQIYST